MEIALKEARETKYWLELLYESDTIEEKHFSSIVNDNNIHIGTITNIVKKTKEGSVATTCQVREDGSLNKWPDEKGFFTARKRILFGEVEEP